MTADEAEGPLGEADAYREAEAELAAAAALFGVPVTLRPGLRNSVDFGAGGLGDRNLVNVEVSYRCELPEPDGDVYERNRECFTRLADAWRRTGVAVSTLRLDPPFFVLRGRNEETGYSITLKQGRIGNLWLTVSSPPAVRSGTAPPPPSL